MSENISDDRCVLDLVTAAQDGDNEALVILFKRFYQHLYIIAYNRLGNENDALDLMQDVFIQVFNHLAQLQEPKKFSGWIRSITINLARNKVRRLHHDIPTEPHALQSQLCHTETPLDLLFAKERVGHLYDALSRLKELDRNTLISFYIDGNTLIQMSEIFESPVGTIKRRLYDARKRFAKKYSSIHNA